MIFLKQKYKPNGDLDKLKARLVAGGHRQHFALYSDTSSPNHIIMKVFVIG